MSDPVNRFYRSIEGTTDLTQSDLIDLFVYYLVIEASEIDATPKSIKDCFVACDLSVPARISAHLSEGTKKRKSRPAKFIKTKSGYRLERKYKDALAKKLGAERVIVQTSVELR